MADSDDYRTLKPTAGSGDDYRTLKPSKKPAPPPPARRPDAKPTAPPPKPVARPEPPAPVLAADPLPLVGKPAGPFCRLVTLGDAARRLLDEKQTLLVYLYRLMKERLHLDAVRLLARALPRREAVRWACECAGNQGASDEPPLVAAALGAVEAWLAEPNEHNRRACGAAAAAAGYGVAAGSAALAVFLSGGNIAPAPSPPVAPGDHLAARAVANAVALAALAAEPGKAPERYFQFLKAGIALATDSGRRLERFANPAPA